jgi:hypothetical protein
LVRLTELLEDGEWHRLDQVIREVGKLIPPGRAVRQAESDRLAAGGPPQRKVPLPVERQIESGRRTIVRSMLGYAGGRYFEVDPRPRGGVRASPDTRVRMKEVPASVARDRKLAADGRSVNSALIDSLIASDDPRAMLAALTGRDSVERVVLLMLDRLRSGR